MNKAQEFIKDKTKNWKEKRFGSSGELLVHWDELERWLDEYCEMKVKNLDKPDDKFSDLEICEYCEHWDKQSTQPLVRKCNIMEHITGCFASCGSFKKVNNGTDGNTI